MIDALRHDYVTPQSAPFLYRLMQEGHSGPLIPSYGFQEHPGFLTGRLPQETSIGHTMYMRDPAASPFARIDVPSPSVLERHPGLERALRPVWDRKTCEIENARCHSASACYGNTAQIPPALLKQFAFGWVHDSQEPQALGVTSVYDLLRAAGKSWLALGHPRDDQRTEPLLAQFQAAVSPEHTLVYLHFGALDWLGHEHGPGSRRVLAELRGLDQAVERVLARLEELHGNVAALVFGDHGMVAVESTVDVQAALDGTGLMVPDDYVYFLDSTAVRLWPAHHSAAAALRGALDGLAGLRAIEREEMAELGIAYGGDSPFQAVMYAAETGVLVCPNFFLSESIRGMHGYLPDVTDNWSRYIAHNVSWMPGRATLTMQELFPIIVRALGMEQELEQAETLAQDAAGGPAPETTGNNGAAVESRAQAVPGRLPRPRAAMPDAETASTIAPGAAPLVSVIIPTYNRARLLPRLAEALAAQSHAGSEVVFVDDGSDDDTPAALGEICDRHDGWRMFRQENAGPAAARNLGVGAASGELLVFLDDDCVPHPRFIEEHVLTHVTRGKGYAAAGHTPWHPDLEVSPFMEMALRGVLFAFNRITDHDNLSFTCFYTANCSVRRDDLVAIGGFDEALRFYEDADLAYRLRERGISLVYNERAVAYHAEPVDLAQFLTRQRAAGTSAVQMVRKYPHLADEIGVTEIANPQLREQYYATELRHAFIQGVEDALRESKGADAPEAVTRDRFEEWMHGWVSDLVARHAELEGRLHALEDTVMQKDQYIRELVQSKDETINGLEATLQRYHSMPPFRLYFWLKERLRG